ncbi:MAG: DUF1858 domain-containing protein [Anaerolineales bacterium]|nr:DUF1858 domain-containing protein [Anaerolineales bacterium]
MISSTIPVADLLTRYPLAAALFIELRVDCIGCSMNRFCTLEELCKYYDLDMKKIIDSTQKQVK